MGGGRSDVGREIIMIDSNKKKCEQLGMSHGTAVYRLNKQILFAFAQQLDQDICHRCGKKITSIREFSVDHKIPWLDSGAPVGLFFDSDNIAFSHLGCNIRNGRHADVKGEHNHSSKLTEEIVKEIRTTNQSAKSLAEKFGVSASTIYHAKRGASWKHIKK